MQKTLYGMMAVLGVYIVYKGGVLLWGLQAVQTSLDTGKIQQKMENTAARTWMPGYTAVLEGEDQKSRIGDWFREAAPVYSYLNEMQKVSETDETSLQNETSSQEETRLQEETSLQEETETNDTDAETEKKIGDSKVAAQEVLGRAVSMEKLAQLADFDYFLNEYFTVDGGTTATEELLNAETFLSEDLRIVKNAEVPQILIYHTHSQEAFADSVEGDPQTTIVGMGEVLAEELRGMGYQVIHDTGEYDLAGGVLDRSAAYDYAGAAVADLLEEYPTIQVVIDLHRDGVDGQKFVTEIDGKKCSMIMFFNGISRNEQDEMLTYLPNPYIKENLAFSFQMQWKAREQYPGFTRNIYLKAERFNLHFRPRSLLIEAGTQLNTVEEERNAMKPLADLLNQVLDPTV